jgi:hypothetical protein
MNTEPAKVSLDKLSETCMLEPSMRKISNKHAVEITALLKTVVAKYGDAVKNGERVFTPQMGVDSPGLAKAVIRLQLLMTEATGGRLTALDPVLASLCKSVHDGKVSDEAVNADSLIYLEAFYRNRRNG